MRAQQAGRAHVCDALKNRCRQLAALQPRASPWLNCHRKLPAAVAHVTEEPCCRRSCTGKTKAAKGAEALAHFAVKCTSSLFRTVPVPLSAKLSPVREVEERAQTGNLGAAA